MSLTIRPGRFGWPSVDREYAPGLVGLDYAIGRQVTVHDWYGARTGTLLSWDLDDAGGAHIELQQSDGTHIPYFTLSTTREITVEELAS